MNLLLSYCAHLFVFLINYGKFVVQAVEENDSEHTDTEYSDAPEMLQSAKMPKKWVYSSISCNEWAAYRFQ